MADDASLPATPVQQPAAAPSAAAWLPAAVTTAAADLQEAVATTGRELNDEVLQQDQREAQQQQRWPQLRQMLRRASWRQHLQQDTHDVEQQP